MNLNELKTSWQNSGAGKKNMTELETMTKISHHPTIRRIGIKLIIEIIFLIAFIILYNDFFDGENKPLWVTVLLVASALLFIGNDVIGLISVFNPIKENTLTLSLNRYFFKLKKLAFYSILSSLLFGTSVILFFTSTIDFNNRKYMILAGMVLTMLAMIFISYKNWTQRIAQVRNTQMEFEED